jgi:hypothetical protein
VCWIGDSKGWGIKTLENLEAGAFVFEFVGEVVNNEKLARWLDMCLANGKIQRIMHYLWMGTRSSKG